MKIYLKVFVLILSLFVYSSSVFSKKGNVSNDRDISDPMAQKVGVAVLLGAGCNIESEKSPQKKAWCVLANMKESKVALPTSKKAFLGITLEVPYQALEGLPEKSGDWRVDLGNEALAGVVLSYSLSFNNRLAVLHLSPDYARLTALDPTNPQEEKEASCIQNTITGLLNGSRSDSQIDIPKSLEDFLKSELNNTGYLLKKEEDCVSFFNKYDLPSRIFLTSDPSFGEAYLVLEKAKEGFFVNLFPIKEQKMIAAFEKKCPKK